jgi:hypothetical protein
LNTVIFETFPPGDLATVTLSKPRHEQAGGDVRDTCGWPVFCSRSPGTAMSILYQVNILTQYIFSFMMTAWTTWQTDGIRRSDGMAGR